MLPKLVNFLKTKLPSFLPVVGSFIITAGWDWYHLAHRPHCRFILISLAVWAAVWAAYRLFKWLFVYLTGRFERHPFWQKEFPGFLDELFFIFSLSFLIFFSRSELISLFYFSAVMFLFYWRFRRHLARHPAAAPWLAVNKGVFILIYFIFLLSGFFQYLAYRYYILDLNAKFYNIALFRAWSVTMFWVLFFAVANLVYWRFKNFWRYALLGLWLLFFIFVLVAWIFNLGILLGSGLYLSPIVLEHASGAGAVIWTYWRLILLLLVLLTVGVWVLFKVRRAHREAPGRYWLFYNFALIGVAVISLFGVASFWSAPEVAILKSFYYDWRGEIKQINLPPLTLAKLKAFGLNYDLTQFYFNHHPAVFSSQKQLLPAKFLKNRPNIIIIFLESFSTRLTDVYNSRWKNLTPGLKKMADDPDTTVFKKYYNASTPTVTGLMSELCSFLPPTGHNEIEQEKMLQRHYLLCLPKILRQSGGYAYSNYVTAVEKNYASKDTIFESMGVDEIFGTEELKKYISGEPLAWGYSDHQMFPVLTEMTRTKPQPYLMMLSTVDTHPPFTTAKDIVPFGKSKSNFLNSLHTTDDAFLKFWEEFKSSPYATNTILIAVADHAVFPTAYDKVVFPEERGKMTFYDENVFQMYVPQNILPKEINEYSSALDFAPTLLQLLNLNVPNGFEGHSIFDDRDKYPNLLGMHEFGLYINQLLPSGQRQIDYAVPADLNCSASELAGATSTPLTLCEYLNFYHWKRQMFEQGRFWEK